MMQSYRVVFFCPDKAGTRLPVGALVQVEDAPATWVQAERLPCSRCVPDSQSLDTLFLGLRALSQHVSLRAEPRNLPATFELGEVRALPSKWPPAAEWLREHLLPRRAKGAS